MIFFTVNGSTNDGQITDDRELQEDISCYFNSTENDLPPFDNEDIDYELTELTTKNRNVSQSIVKRRHIFFHETSCRGDLTPRQACTIESAARAHPNWTIYVLFSAPISTKYAQSKESIISRILLPNVKLRRIHISEYVRGTPAENIVGKGLLDSSKYRISHTSDVLRFTTLYKHPGVYLDLDIIVVKPLDSLASNFAIAESKTSVAVGALGLADDELGRSFAYALVDEKSLVTVGSALSLADDELGRSFAYALVEELSATFDGEQFSNNGPGVITRVLQSWCGTKEVPHMSKDICQGISIYRPAYAYPINWENAEKYFEGGKLSARQTKFAYMYHVWGKVSSHLDIHEDSPFHQLAKTYCPTVYKDFRREFGWRTFG
ncbi:alpha 1,4-glycosyltransferase conserved region domain-containing protein [Phthorimaea operculella]|nr:alpha 1,4-glycosyltransferase conserved region domain-containing protein [Phthorimaea operculella]